MNRNRNLLLELALTAASSLALITTGVFLLLAWWAGGEPLA